MQLRMSGPGVFAVAARAKIKRAAVRLSIASSSLVIVILLAVYRSLPALILGLLPVATGALTGIAAVALGFGAVHGVTLGFGITLIGESVDYSIYFFIQSSPRASIGSAPQSWRQRLWPTMRLGMLTSVCGFASLVPSGFPGLAQLGAYSISGLIAAAAVTRFVLPELLPGGFRDTRPHALRYAHRGSVASGAPFAGRGALGHGARNCRHRIARAVPSARYAVESRALQLEPGADCRNSATTPSCGATWAQRTCSISWSSRVGTLESVLRGAERTARTLQPLIDAKIIGGFDSPANYLPSLATQETRRNSLPDLETLRENLREGTAGLALHAEQLRPFVDDVEAARRGALITPQDLQGDFARRGFRRADLASVGSLERAPAAARSGSGGARHRSRARQRRAGRRKLERCATPRSQEGIRCALCRLSA